MPQLPSENPQYIAIDARTFYVAKTVNEQFSVDDIQNQIAAHQSKIDDLNKMLSDASAAIAEQATADPSIPTLDTSSPAQVATPPVNDKTP